MGIFSSKFDHGIYRKAKETLGGLSDFKLVIAQDLVRTTKAGTFSIEYMQALSELMVERGLSRVIEEGE